MESTERIAGDFNAAAGAAAMNLFEPDVDDEDTSEVDILTKSAMVSPTEEQFTLLHSRLRERLLQGETIYEIGIGGKVLKRGLCCCCPRYIIILCDTSMF